MPDRTADLRKATVEAVTKGQGFTSAQLRQSVMTGTPPEDLCALVEKIRLHAYKVTDEDLAILRDRYSEDQLFEVIVAASIGAADSRMQAALRALDEA